MKLTLEPGRYRLYAAFSCPFAHRVRLVRLLHDALPPAIALSFVTAQTAADGFVFDSPEPEFGALSLKQVYNAATPENEQPYTGKATVPLLIDRTTKAMVNNESLDLATALAQQVAGTATTTFLPEGAKELAHSLSDKVTMAVYRRLLAPSAQAKADILSQIYLQLDHYEQVLETQPYVMGEHLTLPDCVLWPSLFRYDNVYARQFGMTDRTIRRDYPALCRYVERIYRIPLSITAGSSTATTTTTIGEDAKLSEVIRMYWQSAVLSPVAGNDPQSPVPDPIPLF